MTTPDLPLVDQLRARDVALVGELEALLDARRAERAEKATVRASLPEDQRAAHDAAEDQAESAFRAAFGDKNAEIDELRAQLTQEESVAERKASAAKAAAGISHIGDPPAVYRRDNQGDYSYWADLAAMHGPGEVRAAFKHRTNQAAAEDRLRRHAMEMDVRAEEKRKIRERTAVKQIEDAIEAELRSSRGRGNGRRSRIAGALAFERRVNPSTIQGEGGYFAPPEWIVSDFIPYLRAGRVASDLCRHMDVPPGVSSVSVPKVTTPTLVAAQGANNVAVVSQDITDSAVATGFRTFAGQEDVAVQWLDMSPGHITDQVITEDLTAAYNLSLDNSVVNGTATANSTSTGGPLCGLYPYGNWGATNVTCTQGSPTPANLFGTFGAQLSQIAQARYDTTDVAFLMHPRRAYWYLFGLDGAASRPFMESDGFSPYNPAAIAEQEVSEGQAFTWPSGHKVYASKNVTTADATNGASAADVSIAFKSDDVWLFEDTPRTRVLQEVLSGTLQVRFQIYNYAGLIVRYGSSIAIAAGSGFAAPTVNGGSF